MAATTTFLRVGLAVFLLLLGCGFAAAQQVTVERDSPLHAEPRADAPVVTTLKQGTTGEATGKQGPWLNLKTPAASGWILSFNVRFATGQTTAPASGGLGRLGGQKPSVTPTIGIRGIEAEDLKRASFDARQMSLLENYAASKADGENTARASGLSAVRVEYMAQ